MKKCFYLIFSIGFIALLHGCDEDSEPEVDPGPPKVVSTVPTQGAETAGNAAVTFALNKPLAEANVAGAAGTTRIAGRVVTFTPSPFLPTGSVTLTLTGVDESGQKLEPFALSFIATEGCGGSMPTILDAKCMPENGAAEVDPQEYTEKLTIVFSERLAEAIVVTTEPEFPFEAVLNEDTLEIRFLDYAMPYETEFTIKLYARDFAGNELAKDTYSFKTKAEK